jgi:hypothetical protein
MCSGESRTDRTGGEQESNISIDRKYCRPSTIRLQRLSSCGKWESVGLQFEKREVRKESVGLRCEKESFGLQCEKGECRISV